MKRRQHSLGKPLVGIGLPLVLVLHAAGVLAGDAPALSLAAEWELAGLREAVREAADFPLPLQGGGWERDGGSVDGDPPIFPHPHPGPPLEGEGDDAVVAELDQSTLPASPNPLGNHLVALNDAFLDNVRGGFEPADSHLKLSFGIERAVFINGTPVVTTVLNLGDMAWVGGAGRQVPESVAAAAASFNGALGVIQNGVGNSAPVQVGDKLAGTVIQNTLNDQQIQTATTINAVVNSAAVLRAMSIQSAMQAGIVNSLRR